MRLFYKANIIGEFEPFTMRLALVCLLVFSFLARFVGAFPPAPGIIVFGLVKDANGRTVDGPNAYVVFKSGSIEVARSLLIAGVDPDENYRALLPSDMSGSFDGYRDAILDAAVPFTVQVEIGGQRFDPIESSRGLEAPDDPGSAIRFDFSLGSDSDSDGLPDEWEYWQLRISGLDSSSSDYNLDQFYSDGDFDEDGLSDRAEYLAGTFAYLGFDEFEFKILEFSPDYGITFRFLGVRNRRYEILGSVDLHNWLPVPVQLVGELDCYDTINPIATGIFQATIPSKEIGEYRYFRIKVR